MSDFLDRYGEQLLAARRRADRRRSRILRRGPIASLVLIAVAAPAIAVVEPWNPTLGRPRVDGPVSVDRSPVPPSVRDVLAVLRRPQTARDRRLARPHLRNASSEMTGVQVDGIRAVSPDYALVPIKGLRDAGRDLGPMVCLLGSGGAACNPSDRVARDGLTFLSGGEDGTQYVGVVPDGVARVRFTPQGGAPAVTEVHQNFFDLRVPEHGRAGRTRPPKEYTGPRGPDGKIAGPVGPVQGELEWLDPHGKPVGPAHG
jgi:hypothetical protein